MQKRKSRDIRVLINLSSVATLRTSWILVCGGFWLNRFGQKQT